MSPSQNNGKTWADLVSQFPVWLLACSAATFIVIIIYALATNSKLGILGEFGTSSGEVNLELELTEKVAQLEAALANTRSELSSARRDIEALETKPVSSGIPAGMVMAMGDYSYPEKSIPTQDGCPSGWVRFEEAEGRFIVGANARSDNGTGDYWFRRQAGEAAVKLTVDQMPRHTHKGKNGQAVNDTGGNNLHPWNSSVDRPQFVQAVEFEGGNEAHNNMPPYIALFYCKKLPE